MTTIEAYAGKKILVTGGLGFIGSNLIHNLARIPSTQIVVLDSLAPEMGGNQFNLNNLERPVEICIADMADQDRIAEMVTGVDFIFNLAGQISHIDSMANPFADLHANYSAHLSLLEACRLHNPKVKIVFASTRQVYGRTVGSVSETHPANPLDINGNHKLAAETCHRLYHDVYGIKSVVLRLNNTYGPRQMVKHPRQGFIGWFIRKAVDGEEIQIFGSGKQRRSLNHVDDVVSALLLAGTLESDIGTFNLGSEQYFSLEEIAAMLIELSGKGSIRYVEFPPERKCIDIGDVELDFSLFHSKTGWTPKVDFKEGLRTTLDFYQKYYDGYWN
jgi:UDP-glucose 4-epimerase